MTASTLDTPAPSLAAGKLESALAWARRGLRVFPVNGKQSAVKNWPARATTDETRIRRWWSGPNAERNIGLAMGDQLPDGRFLMALDVDMKRDAGGRLLADGEASLRALCAATGTDPTLLVRTLTQLTPSGTRPDGTQEGGHLVLSSTKPLGNTHDALGPGLDTRGAGGYIVAAGSEIDDRPYLVADWDAPILELPEAIEAQLTAAPAKRADRAPLSGVAPDRAEARAREFLATAPGALKGSRGSTAYKLAARVRELGCDEAATLELLSELWADRCEPPMPPGDLAESVNHAFRYAQEAQGSAAPEANFAPVPRPGADAPKHPVHILNREFAYTPAGGGHILWETTDAKGRFTLQHLDLATFHAMHANRPFQAGDAKPRPVSKWWMEWEGRRSYDGLVFAPQRQSGPRWYNLWRGFAVQPAATSKHRAVDQFLEHARLNVCDDDPILFRWLMGYFAHLVQRPWEKPLVALVFKGQKGTGKNALIERIGYLLGPHFLVVDDDRYLLGQFNGHLENCLCMVLDEAFWSGNPKAEGRLKGLITGTEHVIEQKGREPYRVDNLTRIVLLSNADWVVPASQDERRFAVFTLGDGRRQDRQFFQSMREGMEDGGYACLLRYLLDYDLSGIDINGAPSTRGLVDQKEASLKGAERWLRDVLTTGIIEGTPWTEGSLRVSKDAVYGAYCRWSRERYREHHPQDLRLFWRKIHAVLKAGGVELEPERPQGKDGARIQMTIFPALTELREAFAKWLGGPVDWGEGAATVNGTAKVPIAAIDIFN